MLLFVAGLLVLGILAIAAACGDGDESDEDAVRNAVEEVAAAVNDRDFDRLAELSTANFEMSTAFRTIMDDPDFSLENLEILFVDFFGDEAIVLTTTTEDGQPFQDTVLLKRVSLKREDGRWLVDCIRSESRLMSIPDRQATFRVHAPISPAPLDQAGRR